MYLNYRALLCHGADKSESENLRSNKIFENTEWKNKILKLKSSVEKFWSLESQRFWLNSRWSKSHQPKSTYSKQFEKHRIDPWFSQYLCNRKDIDIAGTFDTYTYYGTHLTNIYL